MTQTDSTGTSEGECPPSPPPPPPPPPPSVPDPTAILREIKRAALRADLLKQVAAATEDLYSTDPARQKARAAAQASYEKAYGTADKGLHRDHQQAGKSLGVMAAKMESDLQTWIDAYLAQGKPIHALLKARADAAAAAKPAGGQRESARDAAAARTRKWAAASAAWGNAASGIDLKYAGEIPKLYDDVDDLAYSTYRFWFEIVPKHLQYSGVSVGENDLKGIGLIRAAVSGLGGLESQFKAGSERNDGGIYLIDPGHLLEHRKEIRQKWEDAATAQVDCELAYQMDPDDFAALRKKSEQLDKQFDEDARAAIPPAQPS
ncbi:MAG TPA: hypothetical protein VEW26_02510 [Allosphingosinicella sp.]|nr:hypothetical protein [Allosphingosinicella sp.]